MKTHAGTPFDDQTFELLGAAPPEIGAVLSVDSTVRRRDASVPASTRLLGGLLPAAVGALTATFPALVLLRLLRDWPPLQDEGAAIKVLAPCWIVGALVGAWLTRGRSAWVCSWVGAAGIARRTFRSRSDEGTLEVLSFEHAPSMTRHRVEMTTPRGLKVTQFDFRWRDAHRKVLFQIEGHHDGHGRPEGSADAFAAASERAFTSFQLAQHEPSTPIEFEAASLPTLSTRLRVGADFVEQLSGSAVERWDTHNVSRVAWSEEKCTLTREGHPVPTLDIVWASFESPALLEARVRAIGFR